MPFLGLPLWLWITGGAAAGGAVTYEVMKGPDDEPVSADERKTARSKMIMGAIGAVAIWAWIKFKGKK